jgi:hypothetical protein
MDRIQGVPIVAVGGRTMQDKLRAVKRVDEGLDVGWILVAVGAVILAGLVAWLRSRRKEEHLDRRILTARVLERGFDHDEADLIHRIADLREGKEASELVPRLRRYDAALEAFIANEADSLTEEERDVLAVSLSRVRKKLGFRDLPEHRRIPSTREIPSGMALTLRQAGRPEIPFVAAFAYLVNDLELKVRVITDEKEGAPPPVAPDFPVGTKLELFFSHGLHRRCRFNTRVVAEVEGDGWTFPLEHVPVQNIDLSSELRAETRLPAVFRMPGGAQFDVTILELSGAGARLASALPDAIRKGSLTFDLPGAGRYKVDVIRPKPKGETPTREERLQLKFQGLAQEAQQKLLRYLSERTAAGSATSA